MERIDITAAAAGLAAAAVFGLAWIFAAEADPGWTLGTNMLSDLGVSNASAAMFFNGGCIGGGMLAAICGACIASAGTRLYRASGAAVALAGISLVFVGVFPSDTGYVHVCFAVCLFVFGMIAMLLMTADNWMHHRVLFAGMATILICFVCITFAAMPLAYSEAMAVAALLLWLSMNCVRMFLKHSAEPQL